MRESIKEKAKADNILQAEGRTEQTAEEGMKGQRMGEEKEERGHEGTS